MEEVPKSDHPALPERDRELIQIVDAALAEATQRAGEWLACRPGCTQCCIGPFPISQLDAARLRTGLAELEKGDPQRAERIRARAVDVIARCSERFPGNAETGILDDNDAAQAAFDTFADDEPCPALDPETGTCDLYRFRPMTCREFGPPVRVDDHGENGLSVCELCFQGATPEEVAACEMLPDPNQIEVQLIGELEQAGYRGQTIVAFALSR